MDSFAYKEFLVIEGVPKNLDMTALKDSLDNICSNCKVFSSSTYKRVASSAIIILGEQTPALNLHRILQQGLLVQGRQLFVRTEKPPTSENPKPPVRIYIQAVPLATGQHSIESVLNKFGELKYCFFPSAQDEKISDIVVQFETIKRSKMKSLLKGLEISGMSCKVYSLKIPNIPDDQSLIESTETNYQFWVLRPRSSLTYKHIIREVLHGAVVYRLVF